MESELLYLIADRAEKIWSMHHFIGCDVATHGRPDNAEVAEVLVNARAIVEACEKFLSEHEPIKVW